MFEDDRINMVLVAFACAGVLSACGPNGGEEQQGSSYSVDSPEAFADSINQIQRDISCELRFNCPKRFGNPVFFRTFYNSREACKSADLPTGLTVEVKKDLEAGRIEYNRSLAEKCFAEFSSKWNAIEDDCSAPPEITGLSEECQGEPDFLTGTVEEGGSCRTNTSCKGDNLVCEVPSNTCGGTCVSDGGSQPSEDPNKGKGASCQENSECAEKLSCAPKSGQSGGVCIEWYSRSEGDACNSDSDCKPKLACRSGQCTTLEILSEGSECPTGLEVTSICEPGTGCMPTESGSTTCQSFKGAGASCQNQLECAGSMPCVDGTCAKIKAPGESCSSTEECGQRECLSDGTCAPFGREACWESNSGQ